MQINSEDKKLPILILRALTQDFHYTSQVISYLKPEFFEDAFSTVLKLCYNYFYTYNRCPNTDALDYELDNIKVTEEIYQKTKKLIAVISELNKTAPAIDTKWLFDQTEHFCKRKLYYLASLKVVKSLDDEENQTIALKELEAAQSFSFDSNLGLNYRTSFEDRYKLYTEEVKRIPFGIKQFDALTNGGVHARTLFLLLGPSGHGKSLIMSSMIANNLRDGLKVACYTFEMGDYQIAERIDANLLSIPINTWRAIGQEKYLKKASEVLDKVKGELYIKEYASGSANATHIKRNLEELKQRTGFVPDIVYVDYLNIMGSASLKSHNRGDLYVYMTVVAEELRRVAQEMDIPIISACQTNRSGQISTDITLNDVGDSHGITKTADYMLSFYRMREDGEDTTYKNKFFFKQLKNRYNSLTHYEKFLVGVDYSLMRIYELTDQVQDVLLQNDNDLKAVAKGIKKKLGPVLKEPGTMTIDDFSSGKYDNDLFSNIKF